MKIRFVVPLLITVACLPWALGCGGDGKPKVSGPPPVGEHKEHPHATVGPHGGHLIELGKEEYHAEMVEDEKAKTVTIYVLDSLGVKAVPIDAADVTINLKHEGKGEQFKLASSPQESDPPGKSSRFVSSDEELAHDIEAKGAEPQLVLEIEGKTFRGKIEHEAHGEGEHKHK